MIQHIRALQGYQNQSDSQIATTAGAVLKGLTGNNAFPNPTVDLKAFQAAIENLSEAMSAQAHGGVAATAQKNNRREELIALLRKLANYVQDNSGGDQGIFLTSGFLAATPSRTRAALSKPSIVSVDFGNSGQLVVKVNRIRLARCFEVRTAALGPEGAPGPWQTAGLFTNSQSMTVANLTPKTTYAFQVRAVGGSTGTTDWSDPVSHICV